MGKYSLWHEHVIFTCAVKFQRCDYIVASMHGGDSSSLLASLSTEITHGNEKPHETYHSPCSAPESDEHNTGRHEGDTNVIAISSADGLILSSSTAIISLAAAGDIGDKAANVLFHDAASAMIKSQSMISPCVVAHVSCMFDR